MLYSSTECSNPSSRYSKNPSNKPVLSARNFLYCTTAARTGDRCFSQKFFFSSDVAYGHIINFFIFEDVNVRSLVLYNSQYICSERTTVMTMMSHTVSGRVGGWSVWVCWRAIRIVPIMLEASYTSAFQLAMVPAGNHTGLDHFRLDPGLQHWSIDNYTGIDSASDFNNAYVILLGFLLIAVSHHG